MMSTFRDMLDHIIAQNEEIGKLRAINEALSKELERLNKEKLSK